jgi:hypothetical protein
LEAEINWLVYVFYGLRPEDIKLVWWRKTVIGKGRKSDRRRMRIDALVEASKPL